VADLGTDTAADNIAFPAYAGRRRRWEL